MKRLVLIVFTLLVGFPLFGDEPNVSVQTALAGQGFTPSQSREYNASGDCVYISGYCVSQ